VGLKVDVQLLGTAVPWLAALCVVAALGLGLVAAYEVTVKETDVGRSLRARFASEAPAPVEGHRQRGERCAWELHLPTLKPWFIRDPEAVARDNPLIERWLVFPLEEAHVVVFAEPIAPGSVADLEQVQTAIIDDAALAFDDLKLLEETHGPAGTILQTRATLDGRRHWQLHRLISAPGCVLHILAFTPERGALSIETQLRAVVDSVKLTTAPKTLTPSAG
jgi:hypothetical protein